MVGRNTFTKDEIKAIYNAVVKGTGKARYEKGISLEAAVLSGYRGLFSNLGYGYYYEDEKTGEPYDVKIPVGLNAIFGEGNFKNPSNRILIAIPRPNKYDKPTLEIEDFNPNGYGDMIEVSLDDFADKLDGIEFNENNAKLFFK